MSLINTIEAFQKKTDNCGRVVYVYGLGKAASNTILHHVKDSTKTLDIAAGSYVGYEIEEYEPNHTRLSIDRTVGYVNRYATVLDEVDLPFEDALKHFGLEHILSYDTKLA